MLTEFNLWVNFNKKTDIRLLQHHHDAGNSEKFLSEIWAKMFSKIYDGNGPTLIFILKYRGIFPSLLYIFSYVCPSLHFTKFCLHSYLCFFPFNSLFFLHFPFICQVLLSSEITTYVTKQRDRVEFSQWG